MPNPANLDILEPGVGLNDRPIWECVLYTVYGDESSDDTKSRVFAVAGVFGSEKDWAEIKRAWLERAGGVIFHASDCETDQGDFAKNSHAENLVLYRDLSQLLAKSNLMGRGHAMDMAAWHKYFAGGAEEIPYLTCFRNVVYECGKLADMCVPGDEVEFTFDGRPETEYNAGLLYDYMAKMKEWGASQRLSEKVSFASRKYVGIQVADLLARETMKHLDNIIGPVQRNTRRSMQAILATRRFEFRFLTHEYFESFRRKLSDFARKLGVDYGEYLRWLERKRLVDNMSNRHAYMFGKWPPDAEGTGIQLS